jgi:hypothetical protein
MMGVCSMSLLRKVEAGVVDMFAVTEEGIWVAA